MKKILMMPLLAAAALLAACQPMLAAMGGIPAPAAVQAATAPLARTTIDETAVRAAYRSLDTIRAGVDVMVQRGILVRNTPRALAVRSGLIAARDALNAADDIIQLLNNPVSTLSPAEIAERIAAYRSALRSAGAAFDEVATAIRGG